MGNHYTDEVSAQIVIALLKEHGIRRIVISPGATNIPIAGSMQIDPFFEIYSSVDERSAAYMACGMAYETGEPVVISCTGATASRNYLPGMTEAWYRKLPVIAITSTPSIVAVGHLLPQCIDRSVIQKDVARISVSLPHVKNEEDFWDCEIKVNRAILEAKRGGSGPVHINIATSYVGTFNTRKLPQVRKISRFQNFDDFPTISQNSKIAVFLGSRKKLTEKECESLERFVRTHNAVVLCDHTSSYRGHGRILSALPCSQTLYEKPVFPQLKADLIIHAGEVSGDYPTLGFLTSSNAPVWRLSEDGELRDRFKTLSCVFEMRECDFFDKMSHGKESVHPTYLNSWDQYASSIRSCIPDLPFSNTWITQQTAPLVPDNSIVHFGILNSLRNWNLFDVKESISSTCNVGGFGIDGCVSSLIGSSIVNKKKLHFGVIGDLAFFYDLNAIGNRHVPANLRILLINNGGGGEFELSTHVGSQFGEQTGDFISAEGHYGSKSRHLVKNYTENLGFKYLSASNKDEFMSVLSEFLNPDDLRQPMLLECFTDFREESNALEIIARIDTTTTIQIKPKPTAGQIIKNGIKAVMRSLPQSVRQAIVNSLR